MIFQSLKIFSAFSTFIKQVKSEEKTCLNFPSKTKGIIQSLSNFQCNFFMILQGRIFIVFSRFSRIIAQNFSFLARNQNARKMAPILVTDCVPEIESCFSGPLHFRKSSNMEKIWQKLKKKLVQLALNQSPFLHGTSKPQNLGFRYLLDLSLLPTYRSTYFNYNYM